MKENFDSLFDPAIIRDTIAFYETRDRWQEILNYRKLTAETGHVDNLFYGDSITDIWPLHEFFPNHSLLNRGIGGDNVHGLYYRLHDDVYPYTPKRVFILIGINGIEQEKQLIIDRTRAVAQLIKERGSEVWINAEQAEWSRANLDGYLDYHSLLKDAEGQLAAEYARPDGTHLTFEAYRKMSALVRPLLA